MSSSIIEVENLGKLYRIGVEDQTARTGWQNIARALQAPFEYLLRTLRPPSDAENLWAIRNISFHAAQGEVLGIIGRNGAGKSTLLKILSRITEPTEGRAVLNGRVGSLLEVGTGFHGEMTGRENIYLSAAILGMSKREIDRKFDEIVDFAGVEKFLDTPVKRYSSGMNVRLGFAVAAHLEPEIMVVDEVLAVGDAAFQEKCIGKMGSASREGRTVLLVSHNMPLIAQICSRAILLNQGSIIFDGNALETTSKYLQGTVEGQGFVSWTDDSAPGTAEFRFRSLRVLHMDDSGAPVLRTDESFKVLLHYQLNSPRLSFRCAVKFYTQGVHIFTSVEPKQTVHEHTGDYFTTVTIPANLLAEGRYSIGVSIFDSERGKKHYVQISNVVSLQCFDPMTGETARGDFIHQVVGVINPLLQWETTADEPLTMANAPMLIPSR